jgi:hypothetical protein
LLEVASMWGWDGVQTLLEGLRRSLESHSKGGPAPAGGSL